MRIYELVRCGARTVPSATHEEARRRVVHLYKEYLRILPNALFKYELDVSLPEAQRRVRLQFERNRNISDLDSINLAILNGTTELIEIHNVWKQRNHVLNFFDPTADSTLLRVAEESGNSQFLHSFLRKK